jgi:hypothetical protein
LGFSDVGYPSQAYLKAALERLQSIDFGAIALKHPNDIAEAIAESKQHALQQFIDEEKQK